MHPSEVYKDFYEDITKNVYQDKEINDKYKFLKGYDLIITFFSSLILETISLDIPTVVIKYKDTEGYSKKCLGNHNLLEILPNDIEIEKFLRMKDAIIERNNSMKNRINNVSNTVGDLIIEFL